MFVRFSIGDVLTRSFEILGKNFVAFVLITALVEAPVLLAQLYAAMLKAEMLAEPMLAFQLSGATLLLTLLFGPLATAAVTYGVLQQLRGKRASVGDCLRMGLSRALPVLGVAIATGLLVMLGAMACLIPGLIFATAYYVATPAAVVERLGTHGSMSRSWSLTEGVRWSVFGLLLIVALIGLAITMVIELPTSALTGAAGLAAATVKIAVDLVVRAFGAVVASVTYHDLRTEKEGVNSQDLARVFD